jgi:hypothetical protein
MATGTSTKNSENILRSIYDYPTNSIQVLGVGGNLVPDHYDSIALTYVASGNGAGQIYTAIYKLAGNTIATLTLSYDASNRLSGVVRS